CAPGRAPRARPPPRSSTQIINAVRTPSPTISRATAAVRPAAASGSAGVARAARATGPPIGCGNGLLVLAAFMPPLDLPEQPSQAGERAARVLGYGRARS